jgi:aminoglycoside phosphotransferase (APT) family kinase protein
MRRKLDTRAPGWVRARHVLEDVLEREVGAVASIGRVKKIGDGLSREIFAAEVELADGRSDPYVVALPRFDAPAELDVRTSRELQLVARLRSRHLSFRIPELIGALPDENGRLALVRRFCLGIELDPRAGRQGSVRPWEIVAEIAAAIHAIPGADVEDLLPGTATRRADALASLAALEGSELPELRDARAWALAHLPPETPSVLLHGDLLGQNILLALDGPHHVIDWEYAIRGDPAHDLAIVTRGSRQPFKIDGGLQRLLDAYHAHGGADVTPDHIHVYELSLHAAWYRDALAERGHESAAGERDGLRGLLRRLR